MHRVARPPLLVACALACMSACSTTSSHSLPPAAATEPAALGPAPAAPAPPAELALSARVQPELDALLTRRGVSGVIALLEGDAAAASCNDLDRCHTALTPASTFKIPNSIIGLETGVIPDAEFVIPWDEVTRSIPAWNQDHTLRSAIRDSAVPYYQELARRVGLVRMRDWVARLGYGNQQIGEQVDQFWLSGPLATTPLQQLEFLRRLETKRLPISARTRDIVFDITRRGELDGKPLHGKTGWADPGGPNEIGWFVGWVDDPAKPRYIAVAVIRPPEDVDLMSMRQAIAEEALRWQPK